MNSLLRNYMKELKLVETVEEYEAFIHRLIENLLQEKFDYEIIQSIRNKGKYMTNEFSDLATRKNMLRAKENLLFYFESILSENQGKKFSDSPLEKYLNNFYLFLEAFKEMIYFYIYDKEKIIKDRHAFETCFNRNFDGKKVRIIILQPVNM